MARMILPLSSPPPLPLQYRPTSHYEEESAGGGGGRRGGARGRPAGSTVAPSSYRVQ